jgi:hypothetical protein
VSNSLSNLIERKNQLAMNSTNVLNHGSPSENALPVVMGSTSLDSAQSEASGDAKLSSGCCGMGKCPIHNAMWALTAAIVVTGTLAIGYLVWFTQQQQVGSRAWQFPATIDASAAVSSEKYSIATGFVGEAEGLFVLDHNSGLLQCTVMYPRIGKFNALFSINVNDAIGAGSKGATYLMVTGQAEFPNASNRPIASTLVYVLNTATGNYAAYAIPFDRTALNAGRPQQAPMMLMGTGQANPVIDRDSAVGN